MGGCFEFPYEELVKVPQLGDDWEELDFTDNLVLGYYFKGLAVVMFDQAGYDVYPFGWESLLPTLKRRLYADLVLRDPEDEGCYLVEVKYRTGQSSEFPKGELVTSIKLREVWEYETFWPESIILLFTSADNYIYAERVSELGHYSDQDYYPVEYAFHYAEKVFPRLQKLEEQFRRKVAAKTAVMLSLRREGRI
jgi:hypothetical protein